MMQMDAAAIFQSALLGGGMMVSAFTAYLASRAKALLLETKLELKSDIAQIKLDYGKDADLKQLTERVTSIAIGCAGCNHTVIQNMFEKRLERLEKVHDREDLRLEEKSQ